MSKTPGRISKAAPLLGEHTEEILTDLLGYSEEEVASLQEQGAV